MSSIVYRVAKSPEAQLAIQFPIMRDQFRKHPQSNPATFAEVLANILSPGHNFIVVPNADVGKAIHDATEYSTQTHVRSAERAIVVTDHFPRRIHLFWLTPSNTLVVADKYTRESAVEAINKYWKRMWGNKDRPDVVVNPFPIDPAQEKIMPQELRDKRAQALDPTDPFVEPNIALLLGGASVQADYMTTISEGVGYWSQIYSTFKDRPETQRLAQSIAKQSGKVDLASDNLDMIHALNQQMATSPPDIIIVKPGEISNNALLPTTAFGGGILLFSPPVGDQEEQNLEFLRLEKLLPSKKDNAQLIHDMLNSPSRQVVNHWLRRAGELRSICLPKNPYEAKTFICRLYTHRVLLAIFLQNQHLVPPRGAEKLWQQLEIRS